MTGVLNLDEIISHLDSGIVIVDPFDRRNVNTSSYDVCLGEFFYREHKPENPQGDYQFFNPYSEKEVHRVWGDKPFIADNAADWIRIYPYADWTGINSDDRVIILPPRETILAHTIEFIGATIKATTMMKARSSFGRSFIEVCKCAGYGDIGYFNRWTMEITNNSRYYHIPLVVGRRIAQIVFFHTAPLTTTYKEAGGAYQASDILEELKAAWTPSAMKPRLYLDRDIKP